jgi:hypothetical protein
MTSPTLSQYSVSQKYRPWLIEVDRIVGPDALLTRGSQN